MQHRPKLIRRKALRERVPYSDTQIWRLEKDGLFPKRVQLGPGAVAWFEPEKTAPVEVELKTPCGTPTGMKKADISALE